jgi:hypothetical protein
MTFEGDLYRLGVKIDLIEPAAVDLRALIPAFHRWIQKQALAGHLLIDVHDYSHVHEGPGILLVAHEGNFSLDGSDGRPGLAYQRKQPAADPLAVSIEGARAACRLLETEGLRFRADEFLVFANDRLLAPNTPEGRSMLESLLRKAFPGARVALAPQAADPRERLAYVVTLG